MAKSRAQPPSSSLAHSSTKQSALEMGQWAEALVAIWLMQQEWQILYRRWHCRWGELDLVAYTANPAQHQPPLIFVEIKARSRGNWDGNGLMALTPQKQTKLRQTAELFLAEHSHLATLPCRFDLALVSAHDLRKAQTGERDTGGDSIASPNQKKNELERCKPNAGKLPPDRLSTDKLNVGKVDIGRAVVVEHYSLTLQSYIPAAFD